MRIGILGGTFNPIHLGHLQLAEGMMKKLNLDKVIFVPSRITPLREKRQVIEPYKRYKMVKLAIEDNKKFEVSRYEIDKEGVSYTIDTLNAFRDRYKNAELFFIAGSDIAYELDKWKDFDKICKISTFVIARRSSFKLPKTDLNVLTVEIETLDVSSSEIRQKIKDNKDVRHLLPDKVYQYIKREGLYKN